MESPDKDNKLPLQIYKNFQNLQLVPQVVSFHNWYHLHVFSIFFIKLYFISYASHVAINAYVVKIYFYLCIGGVCLIKLYLAPLFLMCFS
jgi:hypothetical protein